MSFTIYIEVDATLQDTGLVARIFDFKEDVYRECLRSGGATIGDVGAVDRALEPLTLTVHSKRFLGPISASIKKALERNGVAPNIRVTRLT